MSSAEHHHPERANAEPAPPHGVNDKSAMVRDPVCGMLVDPAKSAHRADYAAKAYFFCSAGCRAKFLADPKKYLGEAKVQAQSAPAGTL